MPIRRGRSPFDVGELLGHLAIADREDVDAADVAGGGVVFSKTQSSVIVAMIASPSCALNARVKRSTAAMVASVMAISCSVGRNAPIMGAVHSFTLGG